MVLIGIANPEQKELKPTTGLHSRQSRSSNGCKLVGSQEIEKKKIGRVACERVLFSEKKSQDDYVQSEKDDEHTTGAQ